MSSLYNKPSHDVDKIRFIDFTISLALLWGKYSESYQFKLFISALTDYNPMYETQAIKEWLCELNSKQFFHVQSVAFDEMLQWAFDSSSGDLKHSSGKFFSISGMEVFDSATDHKLWDQPVIDQPEIGILGILCTEIDGVLCMLMQAKAEPGNINTYQLSPTVQATRSNYLQVHGGKKTKYIEYFNGKTKVNTVLDQYQSEQGARFLGKRNRNIMVVAEDYRTVESSDNHRWVSLGQLKSLMEIDNAVNMDSRSIMSMIDYKILGFSPDYKTLAGIINEYRDIVSRSDFWIQTVCDLICSDTLALDEIRNTLTWNRYFCLQNKKSIPLIGLRDWTRSDRIIEHKENKYFQVMAVKITTNNREVETWDQPIVKQRHNGKVALLAVEEDSGFKFLTQMKHEPGLYDMIEFAPTVQCIEENHDSNNLPRYLNNLRQTKQVYSSYQSEEGGRFYHESSLNLISVVDNYNLDLYPGFVYQKLSQLKQMVQFQQLLNVELRSLLAYF